jgi:alkylated DNA repair dioxygenase AlkB
VVQSAQLSLFGGHTAADAFSCDASFARMERIALREGAWLDVAREWLRGHEALFARLSRDVRWRTEDRVMYERTVAVPRLYAVLSEAERPPIVEHMRDVLSKRYGQVFDRVTLAYYRDGRDSVAWHGDYVARRMQKDALVATVSVGSPRRFLVRPTGGGKSIAVSLGWGDLIVMGGSCQRTHQHAIPKVAHAEPRIAIMYRPVWRDDGADDAERNDR